MDSFKKDVDNGKMKEDDMLPFIKKKFNLENLKKNKNLYALFDFECDEYKIELKSRRCKKDEYADTMIGINKVQHCLSNTDIKCTLVFLFTDGLYYFKLRQKNKDRILYRLGGRNDRGIDERKMYAYIPVELLKPIEITVNLKKVFQKKKIIIEKLFYNSHCSYYHTLIFL